MWSYSDKTLIKSLKIFQIPIFWTFLTILFLLMVLKNLQNQSSELPEFKGFQKGIISIVIVTKTTSVPPKSPNPCFLDIFDHPDPPDGAKKSSKPIQ